MLEINKLKNENICYDSIPYTSFYDVNKNFYEANQILGCARISLKTHRSNSNRKKFSMFL